MKYKKYIFRIENSKILQVFWLEFQSERHPISPNECINSLKKLGCILIPKWISSIKEIIESITYIQSYFSTAIKSKLLLKVSKKGLKPVKWKKICWLLILLFLHLSSKIALFWKYYGLIFSIRNESYCNIMKNASLKSNRFDLMINAILHWPWGGSTVDIYRYSVGTL